MTRAPGCGWRSCHPSATLPSPSEHALYRRFFTALLFLPACALAQDTVWHDRAMQNGDASLLNASLHRYRALTLDLSALRSQLDAAPADTESASIATIDLPMPDGTSMRFRIWRT